LDGRLESFDLLAVPVLLSNPSRPAVLYYGSSSLPHPSTLRFIDPHCVLAASYPREGRGGEGTGEGVEGGGA